MLCTLIITIPGLLVIAFYGSFADRYGLKKTLLVPVIGNFIFCGCILLALFQMFSPYYVNLLLFGSLCSGLSGTLPSFLLPFHPILFILIALFLAASASDSTSLPPIALRISQLLYNGFFHLCCCYLCSFWEKRGVQFHRVSDIFSKNRRCVLLVQFGCFEMLHLHLPRSSLETSQSCLVTSQIPHNIFPSFPFPSLLCFSSGPLLVGEISKHFGFSSSLALGMSVCVVNLYWIVLYLREPVPVLHTPLLEGKSQYVRARLVHFTFSVAYFCSIPRYPTAL